MAPPTLVTGATGLIGNNVVRLLLEQGEPVRVLVRPTSDPRPLSGLPVETATGDIGEKADVQTAVEGTRCVVHAAAHLHIGSTQLELSRKVNVEGSRNVATAARAEGIRMLHISTVDTLGVGTPEKLATEETQFGAKALTSYVISKCEAERAVEESIEGGLDAVILHPCFTIGPWDWKPSSGRMLLAVARRFTPVAPIGGHTVADVRDVAAGLLAARTCGRSGGHYILGGHPITYFDYWRLCAEVSGGSPPHFRAGPLLRLLGGRGGDVWGRITGHEPEVNSAAIRMAGQFHYYSSAKAEQELGYATRPIRTSLEDAWQWLCDYGYA